MQHTEAKVGGGSWCVVVYAEKCDKTCRPVSISSTAGCLEELPSYLINEISLQFQQSCSQML